MPDPTLFDLSLIERLRDRTGLYCCREPRPCAKCRDRYEAADELERQSDD